MATIANSWKTTSSGVVLIVGAIVGFVFDIKNNSITQEKVMGYVIAIVSGGGLLFSKDFNVSGNPPVNITEPDAPVTNPGVTK